ncbi:hypothetical protein MMC22_004008 [Lobaria immixta]|nr:hypothetical protein [Lobaria immixta]
MGEPEKPSRSVKAASSTVEGRKTSKNEESWDHIQDAGLRKKAQNRIAQRLYRKYTISSHALYHGKFKGWQLIEVAAKSSAGERIKKRLESLEQFRDAAASDPTKLASLITDSAEPNDSNVHEGMDSHEVTSPTVAAPSPCRTRCRQVDHNCTGSLASKVQPQEEDDITTSSSPSLPEQYSTILTPLDTTLSFEPFMQTEHSTCNNQSEHTVWELDEAFVVGTNATGINSRPDAEGQSSLEQPFYGLSKSMLPPNINSPNQKLNILENSQDGKTALHVASESGHHSSVQLLLSLEPELLAQDHMGRTALHLAVINEHEEIIQELSRNKSGLEVHDRAGQTALHAAVASGKERAVSCLLTAGADVESKDLAGRTALHLAALKGCNKILQLLLDNGANLNAKINR